MKPEESIRVCATTETNGLTPRDSRGRSIRISGDDVPLTTTLSVAGSDGRANTLITFGDDLIGGFVRMGMKPRFWFCSSCKDQNFLLDYRRDDRVAKTERSFRC